VVTAEGDEVELAGIVSPLEAYGHSVDFSRCGENGSSFARMPTHVAMRLRHEWGTRAWVGLDVWATRHPVRRRSAIRFGPPV
jgi:hypothetical protein